MEERRIAEEIEALRATLRVLRGENGCPWDREQSLDDLISYLIDEAYELLHAEKFSETEHIEEELGDVFFLVIFMHELLMERRQTPLSTIIKKVHEKIVERHPHVFGSDRADDLIESTAHWERIKRAVGNSSEDDPALGDIPSNLPPIRKALIVQKRAAGAGFDWPGHEGVIEKLQEEIDELRAAIETGKRDMIKEEVGDLFFTAVNLARKLQVDSESALDRTISKFVRRFNAMEEKSRASGTALSRLSLEKMEDLWQSSKKPHNKG